MKIAIAAAFAALATVATANAAPIQAPVAHARPVEAGASCLNNRPVSHVAYTPDTSMPVKSCGHLLSTDAIVRDNHWNRT